MPRVSRHLAAGLFGLFLVGCQPLGPEQTSFEARCVAVRDGDSIDVRRADRTERIRLHGIDAPEKTQPYSNVARARTEELAHGRVVRVDVEDRDRYGRIVARVFVDGEDLSLILVREGLAWHYSHYSSDPRLVYYELRARQKRLGLWRDPDPEPPWTFRKKRRQNR